MARLTSLTATAILAFCAAALPSPARNGPWTERRHLLGRLPEEHMKTHAALFASAPPMQTLVLDPAVLSNETSVHPSDSVVAAAKARRGTIGQEDRYEYNSVDYPYETIGRILWSNGVYCTGTLVGPRHVAAARHCAPMDGEQVSLQFQRDWFNGARFPSSAITTAVYIPDTQTGDCVTKEDWVVFILADRVGDEAGYVGATVLTDDLLNQPLFSNFGYPGDLGGGDRTFLQTGITVDSNDGCEAGGPLTTDTDSSGGQSGSALFRDDGGGYYTYGALSIGLFVNNQEVSTWFSGGANFVNAIINTRSSFP